MTCISRKIDAGLPRHAGAGRFLLSVTCRQDELPHATTRGGFLAVLCAAAEAFGVVVHSHGAHRHGWVS